MQIPRLKATTFRAGAALIVAFAISCGNGAPETADTGKGGVTSGDEESLDVTQSTPMALLGGEHLAGLVDRYLGVAAAGTTADPADPAALALSILNLPGRSLQEIAKLYKTSAAFSDEIFGPGGFFRAKDLPRRRDGKPRAFALDASENRIAQVAFLSDTDAFRHEVEIYARQGDAYELVYRAQFAALTLEGKRFVRARFEALQAGPDPETKMRLEASYDTSSMELQGRFAPQPARPAEPVATAVRLTTEGSQFGVTGAFVWGREPAAGERGPGYRFPVTGDVEAFSARLGGGVTQPAAQQLAFLPARSVATLETVAPETFTAFSYATAASRFLAESFAAATDCATLGDTLRARAGTTPLASVGALPKDLCAAASSPELAQQLALAAADLCAAGIDAAPTADNGSTCTAAAESQALQNPQLLVTRGGAREDAAASDDPQLTALQAALVATNGPDLRELRRAFGAVTRKRREDFGALSTP